MNNHSVYKSSFASHGCMPHNKYPRTSDHPEYVTSDRIFATSNLLCQSYLNFINGIKELQKNSFDQKKG